MLDLLDGDFGTKDAKEVIGLYLSALSAAPSAVIGPSDASCHIVEAPSVVVAGVHPPRLHCLSPTFSKLVESKRDDAQGGIVFDSKQCDCRKKSPDAGCSLQFVLTVRRVDAGSASGVPTFQLLVEVDSDNHDVLPMVRTVRHMLSSSTRRESNYFLRSCRRYTDPSGHRMIAGMINSRLDLEALRGKQPAIGEVVQVKGVRSAERQVLIEDVENKAEVQSFRCVCQHWVR